VGGGLELELYGDCERIIRADPYFHFGSDFGIEKKKISQ
jgi:hypothetical protein